MMPPADAANAVNQGKKVQPVYVIARPAVKLKQCIDFRLITPEGAGHAEKGAKSAFGFRAKTGLFSAPPALPAVGARPGQNRNSQLRPVPLLENMGRTLNCRISGLAPCFFSGALSVGWE